MTDHHQNRRSVADVPLGTPLYKEVKRQITDSLRSGEWKPGEAIPAEKVLAQRFSVSVGTLRKAVDELTAENILIRHQGRGTFVPSHGRSRHYFFSFFHIVRQDGMQEFPSVQLVEFARRAADADTAAALGIAVGAKLITFTNRLSLQGEPIILDQISVPATLFPGLTERMLRDRTSTVYQFYQERFGISVVHADDRLRAASASDAQAQLLGVPEGSPLLLVVRIASSFRGQPVELRHSYVNTARHEYSVDLTERAD